MRHSGSAQPISDDDTVDEEVPVAALDHALLLGLYRHWQAKCGSRPMPARADFLPEEMQPYLSHIFLIDVEPEPRRFRFRLLGTEIVTSYGVELTGKYTDAVEPSSYRTIIERHYGLAVERAAPVLHRLRFVEHSGRTHDLMRLTLPLSDDGRRVNMLMLASVFGQDLARFRERRRAERSGGQAG
jgi:hypothetical protein